MSWSKKLSRPDARMSNHHVPRPSGSVIGPGRIREGEGDKNPRWGDGLAALRGGFDARLKKRKK